MGRYDARTITCPCPAARPHKFGVISVNKDRHEHPSPISLDRGPSFCLYRRTGRACVGLDAMVTGRYPANHFQDSVPSRLFARQPVGCIRAGHRTLCQGSPLSLLRSNPDENRCPRNAALFGRHRLCPSRCLAAKSAAVVRTLVLDRHVVFLVYRCVDRIVFFASLLKAPRSVRTLSRSLPAAAPTRCKCPTQSPAGTGSAPEIQSPVPAVAPTPSARTIPRPKLNGSPRISPVALQSTQNPSTSATSPNGMGNFRPNCRGRKPRAAANAQQT
jgi:hypothetical protein